MSIPGHYWTIAPLAAHLAATRIARRPGAPPAVHWSASVGRETFGEVRLGGLLRQSESHAPQRRALLIVIHGLGGNNLSHYVLPAARAADELELSCLRLNLRGVAGAADDFYHAGLWQDLAAVVASDTLADYTDIYLLGYSMGGHVALRYATEQIDPRVRAVAAICSPLDLDRSAAAIDRPARWVYRHHVLMSLKRMVAPLVERRGLPIAISDLMRIKALRQWDERVIAPRHGFDSAEDYYAKASVAPRLRLLERPALLVESEADPMVTPNAVRPSLENPPALLDVHWTARGGHVGFPKTLDLGERAPLGLERQVLAWLLRKGREAAPTSVS